MILLKTFSCSEKGYLLLHRSNVEPQRLTFINAKKTSELESIQWLQIPNRMLTCCKIVFYVQPESQDEVDNDGATKSKKRNINEVKSNSSGVNVKLLSQKWAYPEGVVFDILF